MSDIICVTNRHLCAAEGSDRRTEGEDGCETGFLERIKQLARCQPAAILLREKDLSEAAYEALARQVMENCAAYGVPCILHTYVDVAVRLGAPALHLPLAAFRQLRKTRSTRDGEAPLTYGVSIHSPGEAREAESLGCGYVVAGHIFETDCKGDQPGRGLSFLKEVCEEVRVPVLAIGGITADNADEVRRTGAAGLCVMSGAMQSADVEAYLDSLRRVGPWRNGGGKPRGRTAKGSR